MSSSDRDPSTNQSASFAESLPALKRRGCSVLVVGTVPDGLHEHACERLLGDDATEPRRRLLVRSETDGGLGVGTTTDTDPSTRVIEHGITARSTAAGTSVITETDGLGTSEAEPNGPATANASSGTESAPRLEDATGDGDVVELGGRVVAAIEDIEATVDALSPAELRVCFDSLFALVDAHEHEAVVRSLRPVFAAVREARGMAHCHLPVVRDADVVDALAPLFDAVVELRVERGCSRQRWHLRDGPSSEWLPLESPTANTRGASE